MGMDLVGFAPVSRWEHAPYLLSPQAILPESQTVVVGAIHITDTWTEMGGEPEPQDHSPGGWRDQNSLLDRVAYRTVRVLNDAGHKAIGIASSNIWRYRQYEGIPSLFAPDLSHIHAAAAAGLAEIGWSGLAITPEFGSRMRFISIVTDAVLTPTPMYDGPALCDMCMECAKHCPTASLRKELGKPHEVKIGGKTYRYANKNMWRCAWAEHFNLDLNSESLKKWDKIGEKEIMQEKQVRGERGHERGVCQKFCVPPHLRTREPSFGRTDKLIAQNRINKRYPENMPTLRKIRDDVFAAAVRMGVDICSLGPIQPDTEAGKMAIKEAPGMRTVLAFGIRVPKEMYDSKRYGSDSEQPSLIAFHMRMHHILLRLSRMIEDCGYHASSCNNALDSSVEHMAARLAEMAGLGTCGKDAFETPEFGRHVQLGIITTDALLEPLATVSKIDPPQPVRKSTSKQLRFQLETLAAENLVSLFGVAPAERFGPIVAGLKARINETELGECVVDTDPKYHGQYVPEARREKAAIRGPKDYLPEARSVIVLGMHFPEEIVKNSGLEKSQQIGTYAFWQYQTRNELFIAASILAQKLSRQGYQAIITENMLGIGSKVTSHRGDLPDARCNALEAVAAGLGQIGENGSLLTPEYGAHQRQIAIITNAELPANEVYEGKDLCAHCGNCHSKCPMKAFESATFDVRVNGTTVKMPVLERHRCDWSKRYGLCGNEGPALIGNNTDVAAPQSRIRIEDMAEACKKKDPVMKRRACILESCLRHC
ncbi:MAG: hypothetical protein PHV34_25095, partial [Verrucomicrobiae bacterium]|nr:hypothetical protein [Verrucomicrobiae bacterium]